MKDSALKNVKILEHLKLYYHRWINNISLLLKTVITLL